MLSKLFYFINNIRFKGSSHYWDRRYRIGGNSGSGSYNQLAEFKAEIINGFVKEKKINTVLEFGCGDGNQLTYAEYPVYLGLDVSPKAIKICMDKFAEDTTKSFYLYDSLSFKDNNNTFGCDLTMSLDVLYHLIEEEIYNAYLTHLFNASKKYVIIYSSNKETTQTFHEKDRIFTQWVEANAPSFKLIQQIDNRFPDLSKADFYFYEKSNSKI